MAHVGRLYPFLWYRDYSDPLAGFTYRLPWQWKFVSTVMRPGPFSDWFGKTVISGEPYFSNSKQTINWDIPAPAGAVATNSMRVEYRLTGTSTFYDGRCFYLMSGVEAQEWIAGAVFTRLDAFNLTQLVVIHSPPWPGAVPVFGPVGNFIAADWNALGVAQSPAYPF